MRAALGCQPKPRERSKHLEIIDLLLSDNLSELLYNIQGEAIACAIDGNNFAGLSRVLEICHSAVVSKKVTIPGPRGSPVAYAKRKGALDFVSLLEHYPWLNGTLDAY
jgi:hypothetical protein